MMSSAQEILQTVFGYEQFRPGQAQVIQQVLNRQNTLAVMPTGGWEVLVLPNSRLIKAGRDFGGLAIISLDEGSSRCLTTKWDSGRGDQFNDSQRSGQPDPAPGV